jgi:hypothetical protein
MPNHTALSLFPKGKAGVIQRMTSGVRVALSKKGPKFRKWFAEEFELENDRVNRLARGEESVDFEFFEKVKGPLGLSTHKVLGNPSFTDAREKEYWSKEREVMPMVLTAPAMEPGPHKPRKQHDDIELYFYLRRRAIHELVWDI